MERFVAMTKGMPGDGLGSQQRSEAFRMNKGVEEETGGEADNAGLEGPGTTSSATTSGIISAEFAISGRTRLGAGVAG
jgi:hypothetical protein